MKKLIFGLILSAGMSGMAMSNSIESDIGLEIIPPPRVCYNQAVVDVYGCDGILQETRYSSECMRDCLEGEAAGNVRQSFHQLHIEDDPSLCP